MAKNYPSFRALLRQAISVRTQAQFSVETGISAAHLNRILNMETICRPTDATLHKIAAAAKNGVTYQMLVDALEHDDPETEKRKTRGEAAAKDFLPSFHERAEAAMEALSEAVSRIEFPSLWPSPESAVAHAVHYAASLTDPGALEISYIVHPSRPYPQEKMPVCAERWCRADLSMSDGVMTASADLIVYHTQVKTNSGEASVIQRMSCFVLDVFSIFVLMPDLAEDFEKDPEKTLNLPFALHYKPVEKFREEYRDTESASAEERLLRTIFGNDTRFSETVLGLGFWLEEIPENLAAFLKPRLPMILDAWGDESEDEVKISETLPGLLDENDNAGTALLLDCAKYADLDYPDDTGWQAAIALVMGRETGFPFIYKKKADDPSEFPNLSDKGCIILPEDEMERENIHRETALYAIRKYARELGVKSFGDLMHTGVKAMFRKPHTYTAALPEKKETVEARLSASGKEPAPDYSADISSGTRPAENGAYDCLLTDGREIRLIYVKEQDAFVRYHKEWTPWIKAYDPKAHDMW